MIDIPIL